MLEPGEGQGWLARRERMPLGYLGDAAKTAQTFPDIDGVRCSIPGDRATLLEDGRIGCSDATRSPSTPAARRSSPRRSSARSRPTRTSATSIVVGRPSERWGSEAVAIVQLEQGSAPPTRTARRGGRHVARYKMPKAFIRVPAGRALAVGKADYRWAKEQALA